MYIYLSAYPSSLAPRKATPISERKGQTTRQLSLVYMVL